MEILLGFMIFKFIFLLLLRCEQLAAAEKSWRWLMASTDAVLRDEASYDYIVVGAGAAGAVVAARLALAGADVLLIEAGGDPNLISEIPRVALALWGSELDWQYDTISNNNSCLSSRGRQCRFTSGKCLGGSTTINAMMYIRGNQRDFDDMGIPNWTWDDVKPYFLRYEALRDLNRLPPSSIQYHNTSGIMEIGFFSDSEIRWHSRVIAGFEEMNFPFNADVNAKTQIGVSQVIGFVSGGIRMSTARAYLNNVDVKKRLKISKNTYCTNVIIDENNVARGITVVAGIFKQKFSLYARREVILSAGAVGTPKLLMLSGIGPVDHLMRLGIPVRADLPVGDYLRDHIFPLLFILVDEGFGINAPNLAVLGSLGQQALQWLLTRKGPFASDGLTDVTAFLNTDCYDFKRKRLVNDRPECDLPNSQFYSTFMRRNSIQGLETIVENIMHLDKQMFKKVSDANINYGLLIATFVLLQPWSHGTVRLASADPMEKPAIFPNFLSDDRDLKQMMHSITIIEQLIETKAFRRHNAKLMRPVLPECPRYEADPKGYWQCYVRHLTYLVFHPVGTAALGRVLDERLRVRGVGRLRVADASALPMPLRGNPAAAVIAVGERAANFILEDNFIK